MNDNRRKQINKFFEEMERVIKEHDIQGYLDLVEREGNPNWLDEIMMENDEQA